MATIPPNGVYTENNLKVWGGRATAISHHWSQAAAELAANKETKLLQEPCKVVQYLP